MPLTVPFPGPVRTEADELTYCLHIVIRYELEKELFDGSLDVYELETAWADKYEQYLGIRPKTAAEGVLQDIHWAMASLDIFRPSPRKCHGSAALS